MKRREWLKLNAIGGALLCSNIHALETRDRDHAFLERLAALSGSTTVGSDSRITIDVPEVAENAAVVPVRISTTIAGATRMVLLIDKHPFAEVASLQVSTEIASMLATHVRMERPCRLIALVESERVWHSNSAKVMSLNEHCNH